MSASATEVVTDMEGSAETSPLDSFETLTKGEPKSQVWRRLEEIEDDRRLRDELADWEDFTLEN